jgi:DNA-binding GntR family transcriptional regulator
MNKIDPGGFSLQSQVFKEIENAILDGALIPGECLKEHRLSEELGVSRTPVREALRLLELEGLVHLEPHRGAVVIGIAEKDIRDIYVIRTRIETLAVEWASANITDKELAELQENLGMQEFYLQRGELVRLRNLDSAFHMLIYNASRSRPLQYMLGVFLQYVRKARELSLEWGERAGLTLAEHRAICEALQAHDSEGAIQQVSIHICNAQKHLLSVLECRSNNLSK